MKTHSLFRTSASGARRPRPKTKLRILDMRMSNPARTNTPPKIVEPTYPAVRMASGRPPSTRVAPPMSGSMVTFVTLPPVKTA